MAKKTSLALVNSATTRRKTTLVSPDQSRVRQNMATCSAAWRGLSQDEKAAWLAYDRMRVAATSPRKLNAYAALLNINMTLLVSGAPLNALAPETYSLPPGLPSNLTVTAGYTGTGSALVIETNSDAYTGLVQVYGAPPAIPGMDTRKTGTGYRLITTTDGLTYPHTNITEAYVAKFGLPGAGAQLVFQFVAIADAGVRGNPLLLTTTVTGTPPEAKTRLVRTP